MPDTRQQPQPNTAQPGEADAPLFPALPVTLGDYTLTHLLGCHSDSDFYVARQSHVERRVVLEVLRPGNGNNLDSRRTLFLSHARARVSTQLTHTAYVLESGTSPEGYSYISQDLPQGHTLASMAAQSYSLTVPQACALILAAGELYNACNNAGLAAGGLHANTIFLNRAGEFNFLSPVKSGSANEGDTFRQTQALAAAIRTVQPTNVPGQTRLETLLTWMESGYEGIVLEWNALCETAGIIAEQLKPETTLHISRPEEYDKGKIEREGKRRRQNKRRRYVQLLLAAAAVLAMGGAGVLLSPNAPEMLPAVQGNYAYCKVNDKVVKVRALPVTIAQYQKFMDTYPTLTPDRQGSITNNIPPASSEIKPADWENMLTAAEQEGEWQGRRLTMDSPVTNVTYWQALMYARHLRAKLPGAALAAAVQDEAGHPGIEEWTADTRPADQLYAKAHVVLPAGGNTSPIPENNPDAFNPQRGFRIYP